MENWWEDPDFGTLEEDQVKSHPIPRAILKRIVYFPCGILTSLFGLILVTFLCGEKRASLWGWTLAAYCSWEGRY